MPRRIVRHRHDDRAGRTSTRAGSTDARSLPVGPLLGDCPGAANGAAGRLGAIRRGRGRDAVALPVAAAGPRAIAHKESRAMMVDAMVDDAAAAYGLHG